MPGQTLSLTPPFSLPPRIPAFLLFAPPRLLSSFPLTSPSFLPFSLTSPSFFPPFPLNLPFLSPIHEQTISDKYRATESELRELELRVETSQRDFDTISGVIRRETRRFEATRIEDFKTMIIRYLETLMAGQRKIVAEIGASVDAMQNNLLSTEEYTTLADLFNATTAASASAAANAAAATTLTATTTTMITPRTSLREPDPRQ